MSDPLDNMREVLLGLAHAPVNHAEALGILCLLPRRQDLRKGTDQLRYYLAEIRDKIMARFPDITDKMVMDVRVRILKTLPREPEGIRSWLKSPENE